MSKPITVQKLDTGERPTRELLRLAMPIIGMTVSRMLMGFIDFAMVSTLGTEAQAAISPASILVFAFICTGLGAAQTIQTFVAQSDGRGEPSEAGAFGWQAVYIGVLMGLLTIPATRLVAPLYAWMGPAAHHAPEVIALEMQYTSVAIWAAAPAVICGGMNGFFQGVRRPAVSLIAILCSIVFNIVGNYALIYGNWGFPEMGIRGAAIATVLGWCVRAAVLMLAMTSRPFDAAYSTRSNWRPNFTKLGSIARIGTPASIQWLVDIGSWVVFTTFIIPTFGMVSMAATNIGIQLLHLSFMPAIGLAIALSSQVGFAIGRDRHDEALARTRVALRLTLGYMGAAGIGFMLAARPLVGVFTDDPEVINAGATVMFCVALFQLPDALCIVMSHALRGAGDTRWQAIVNGLCCWFIFIGGGTLFARVWPELGLAGPWSMCVAFVFVQGILFAWRWQSGAWRSIRLFDEAPVAAAPGAAVPEPVEPA